MLLSAAAFSLMSISAFAQGYYYIPEQGGNPKEMHVDAEWPPSGGLPTGWTSIYQSNDTALMWSPTTPLPSGFAFDFNGARVTQFRASSSGVVTFTPGAIPVPGYSNTVLPSAEIPNNSICVWGLRPTLRTFATGYSNYILTKTFGTAPNRQFWIYYNLYGDPSIQSGWTFFSIVLEETTNNIYIVDQKTVCVTAAQATCTNKTSLTLGVQVNSTTAVTVDGTANYANKAGSDPTPVDNHYYEFSAGVQPTLDMKGSKLLVQENLAIPQGPFDINASMRNVGTAAITSATFNYSINGGTPVTTPLTGLNIAKYGYYNAVGSAKWTPAGAGTYTIKAWMSSINGSNDEKVSNDTITKIVKVWENFVARKSLYEVFTSSTCPPCKPGNEKLHSVTDIEANKGKFTMIKYQYSFPGTGDPYFTLEAQARGTYYGGVNSVPTTYIDGGWKGNPNSFTQAIFDEYQTKPSFVEIKATQGVDASKQSIKVDIEVKPLIAMQGTFTIRTVVVERKTTKNYKTNGEFDFEYVMKKMLPSSGGELVNLSDVNQLRTFTHEYEFPGKYRLPASATNGGQYNGIDLATEHSVEEFEDLVAVIFVQNDQTKEVLQSEWSTPFIYSSVNNNINVADLGVTIYPNPTQGNFNIKLEKAAQTAQVKIFDITGQLVETKSLNEIETNIDCTHYNNGLYLVEITIDGQTTVKKLNIAR